MGGHNSKAVTRHKNIFLIWYVELCRNKKMEWKTYCGGAVGPMVFEEEEINISSVLQMIKSPHEKKEQFFGFVYNNHKASIGFIASRT